MSGHYLARWSSLACFGTCSVTFRRVPSVSSNWHYVGLVVGYKDNWVHQYNLVINGVLYAQAWSNGTWHTWDIHGVGGENDVELSLPLAMLEAELAVIDQGFLASSMAWTMTQEPERYDDPDDVIPDGPEGGGFVDRFCDDDIGAL